MLTCIKKNLSHQIESYISETEFLGKMVMGKYVRLMTTNFHIKFFLPKNVMYQHLMWNVGIFPFWKWGDLLGWTQNSKIRKTFVMEILVVGRFRFKIKKPFSRTKNRDFISKIDFCVLFEKWEGWWENLHLTEILNVLENTGKGQSSFENAFFVSALQGP